MSDVRDPTAGRRAVLCLIPNAISGKIGAMADVRTQ